MAGDIPRLYHKANVGRRVASNADAVPGGFILRDTDLITARWEEAEQWIVTLMPPLRPNGEVPYVSTFDGSGVAYPPAPPLLFTAPVLPDAAPAGNGTAQCLLRWGAGGTAFTTRFDYPVHGAIFGVTADTFDLRVHWSEEVVPEIPDIGAFMVPGIAADPSPLHWLELLVLAVPPFPGPGNIIKWAVKPWAREVRVAVSNPAGLVIGAVQATWLNTSGAVVFSERLQIPNSGQPFSLEVPGAATVLTIANLSVNSVDLFVEWQIGLT